MNLGSALREAVVRTDDSNHWRDTLDRVEILRERETKLRKEVLAERSRWEDRFSKIATQRYWLRRSRNEARDQESKIQYRQKLAELDNSWNVVYSEYLKSLAWWHKRREALERDNKICQNCGQAATEVHHTSYQTVGNECLEDLISLCSSCHSSLHEQRNREKTRRAQEIQRHWLAGTLDEYYAEQDGYGSSDKEVALLQF